jgi:hypothetical protein
MRRDRKQISLLASMLIDKYGERAPAVTAHRVRLWTDADDPATADLWRAVGEAVGQEFARPRHEPTLPEVLDGAVTRATMDADGVSREDVEAVMFAARKKRRRTARRRHTNGRRHTNRRSSRRT